MEHIIWVQVTIDKYKGSRQVKSNNHYCEDL